MPKRVPDEVELLVPFTRIMGFGAYYREYRTFIKEIAGTPYALVKITPVVDRLEYDEEKKDHVLNRYLCPEIADELRPLSLSITSYTVSTGHQLVTLVVPEHCKYNLLWVLL